MCNSELGGSVCGWSVRVKFYSHYSSLPEFEPDQLDALMNSAVEMPNLFRRHCADTELGASIQKTDRWKALYPGLKLVSRNLSLCCSTSLSSTLCLLSNLVYPSLLVSHPSCSAVSADLLVDPLVP